MQGKNEKVIRKRALRQVYVSPNQLRLDGFSTPFDQQLTSENRWVKLARQLPWDKLVSSYDKLFSSKEGRSPINGRVIIGAVIIKHMLNLTDRETILQIRENMFMQYFLGFDSFTNEEPFSAALFVDIRKRLTMDWVNSITEQIVQDYFESSSNDTKRENKTEQESDDENKEENNPSSDNPGPTTHKGELIVDATVAPQNITFPTDLKVVNSSRVQSERLMDKLYNPNIHRYAKPRNYRQRARIDFIRAAKNKNISRKVLRRALRRQLAYLRRNLGILQLLIQDYSKAGKSLPLSTKELKYYETIQLVFAQQAEMYRLKKHSIPKRIVNIHQPHVRPVVRGKERNKTEFGSKLQAALVKGFVFLDKLSWENFNEGNSLLFSIASYKRRFGYYPARVLADSIYCTRENRKELKRLDILLVAKPLGRPAHTALSNHVRPGERNPIEGKFGETKIRYGLGLIKAKLQETSESWIASILLAANLAHLARLKAYCLKRIIQLIEKVILPIKMEHGNHKFIRGV